jgi:hypothetical protein
VFFFFRVRPDLASNRTGERRGGAAAAHPRGSGLPIARHGYSEKDRAATPSSISFQAPPSTVRRRRRAAVRSGASGHGEEEEDPLGIGFHAPSVPCASQPPDEVPRRFCRSPIGGSRRWWWARRKAGAR